MAPWRRWLRDRAYEAGMLVLRPLESAVMRGSLVPATPFLDPATLPWTRDLEAAFPAIREELLEVLALSDELPTFGEITPDVSEIADDRWRTFFFQGYGFVAEMNCRRCPRTAAALRRVPGLTTAFFSILGPGQRIPPHRGPWKGVLRYHLGLVVPDPDRCGIRVGGQVGRWFEGQSMLFDDAYEHEAWNETGAQRVVLFVDVLRPCHGLSALVNRAVIAIVGHSPFVRDARRRHEAWSRTFDARHPLPTARVATSS